jgi:hypothetical protein
MESPDGRAVGTSALSNAQSRSGESQSAKKAKAKNARKLSAFGDKAATRYRPFLK